MEAASSIWPMASSTPLYEIRLAVRRELEDLTPGDTVIVAASGGADRSRNAGAVPGNGQAFCGNAGLPRSAD